VTTAATLTPAERAKEAAFFAQEAAMGEAYAREKTVPATQTIARSMERFAESSEAADARAAEATLFRAAVDIFMDQSSGVDTWARQDTIADNAVRVAKRIQAACKKP
jgi:hypothetical protein